MGCDGLVGLREYCAAALDGLEGPEGDAAAALGAGGAAGWQTQREEHVSETENTRFWTFTFILN